MTVLKQVVIAAIITASVTAEAQAQTPSAEQEVRSRIQQMESAKGDALNDFYVADALMWTGAYLHPHRNNAPDAEWDKDAVNPTSVGKRTNQVNKVTPDRIIVSGDMATEYSTFELNYDDDRGHTRAQGAILRVWQRQNNGWRILAYFQRPYGGTNPLPVPGGK